MQHLIHINDLSDKEVIEIVSKAKKYKSGETSQKLKDKIVVTIFFENSTRTLSSFEIATKKLGGQVVRLDVSKSSTSKGESISDTASNLNAMNPNIIVLRHSNAGAGDYLKSRVSCPIINGGDGAHSHPTQALLDLMTLQENLGNIDGKKIAIVGDIKNSRVANSDIALLSRFGAELILIAPPQFLPETSLQTSYKLSDHIGNLDAIISLRTQTERHQHQVYGSLKDYANDFCITKELIKDLPLVILHPGPVHRNIDISDEVMQDDRCKVLEQVNNGVFIRMATMEYLAI